MPVNSPLFNEINNQQWLWYYHNFSQDNQDNFEFERNILEYHASFTSPEAVHKVRQLRTGKEKNIGSTNEEFNKHLANIFGRDLEGNVKKEKQATMEDFKFWDENIE